MTDIRKKILKKINQGGSMMVEAMAMLALIALVTPTLYKKSAERTTELQDINTASHVRTLSKAVDNYVGTNYQAILDPTNGLLPTDGSKEVTLATLAPYLPYGYSFDELKNFGTPKVSIHRNGDSVTAFVQLPKKTDIGEMRAARIASMIGSNGGYVTADKKAQGVGGVWSLDEAGLNALGFSKDLGSVVVASSEAINSATSGALENEKYLQRTPVPEGEEWRNTMTTDLYMGGHGTGDTSDMHNILGVQKMIVGATEDTLTGDDDNQSYGLVLANSKSAWVDGNLEALQGFFGVIGNDDGAGNISGEVLFFGNAGAEIISATAEDVSFFVEGTDAAVSFTKGAEFGKGEANVNLNTYVATQAGNVFAAGPEDARYIYAEEGQVKLLEGAGYNADWVLTASEKVGSSEAYVKADSELHVTDATYLMGKTTIDTAGKPASGSTGVTSTLLTNTGWSRMLDVQGNALITGKLEATEQVASRKMDAGTLRAGAKEGDATFSGANTDWWLTADANGISSTDYAREIRMLINNTETDLYGALDGDGNKSALELGQGNAILSGGTEVDIYTEKLSGTVTLQDGAVELSRKYTGNPSNWDNTVTVNAKYTDINSSIAKVNTSNYFQVNADGGSTKVLEVKSTSTTGSREDVPLTIDEEKLQASVTGGPLVMEVDYSSDPHSNLVTATDTVTNNTNNASVYIRRGAISLESQIAGKGGTYAADDGVGYVEASRFVSNSVDSDGAVVEPVYALDYAKNTYYGDSNGARADYSSGKAAGTGYDRYMVNPAYTSVMHDIKLTSRGGARLSDILPDFINKGIYVVTNTYRDNINIEQIVPNISNIGGGAQVIAEGVTDVVEASGGDLQGSDRWASPFLGIVPAPQCPPGHAKLMTLTPAGFQMAQATSNFDKVNDVYNPHKGPNVTSERLVILPGGGNVEQIGNENGSNTAKNYAIATTKSETIPELSKTIYYLGYDEGDNAGKEHPKPLYFQQSTWLRSKVIPQELGYTGNRNFIGGDENSPRSPADVAANADKFVGWSAITGFVYPANHYTSVIARVLGDSPQNVDQDRYYWNVFPVQTGTIEAYATVYCYFDRTNIFDSGNDAKYVDQYDQLNNFRQGYHKSGNVMDNSSSGSGPGVNTDYLNRLDDPTLKYDDPW